MAKRNGFARAEGGEGVARQRLDVAADVRVAGIDERRLVRRDRREQRRERAADSARNVAEDVGIGRRIGRAPAPDRYRSSGPKADPRCRRRGSACRRSDRTQGSSGSTDAPLKAPAAPHDPGADQAALVTGAVGAANRIDRRRCRRSRLDTCQAERQSTNCNSHHQFLHRIDLHHPMHVSRFDAARPGFPRRRRHRTALRLSGSMGLPLPPVSRRSPYDDEITAPLFPDLRGVGRHFSRDARFPTLSVGR